MRSTSDSGCLDWVRMFIGHRGWCAGQHPRTAPGGRQSKVARVPSGGPWRPVEGEVSRGRSMSPGSERSGMGLRRLPAAGIPFRVVISGRGDSPNGGSEPSGDRVIRGTGYPTVVRTSPLPQIVRRCDSVMDDPSLPAWKLPVTTGCRHPAGTGGPPVLDGLPRFARCPPGVPRPSRRPATIISVGDRCRPLCRWVLVIVTE